MQGDECLEGRKRVFAWIRDDPDRATPDNVLRKDRLAKNIGPLGDLRLQRVARFVADHWDQICIDCKGHMR